MIAAAGAQSAPVPRLPVPHGQDRLLLPKLTITRAVDIDSFPVQTTVTPFKVASLLPGPGAKVLASFTVGAAVVLNTIGTHGGQIISFGYWPGLTYLATPDYDFGLPDPFLQHLPRGWGTDERTVATMPARLSGALKHAELRRHDNRKPIEGIELLVLDTPSGYMVTLLNWVSPLTETAILVVHTAAAADWTATSVQLGKLRIQGKDGHSGLSVVLPSLDTVDVIILVEANRMRLTR
jgi:hypothetical protein